MDPEILNLVGELDEFKGAWRAMGSLAPDRLTALRHVATIESIGSSTRIEGSKLSNTEVRSLLSGLGTQSFTTRDEQEVAGYAAVMDLIFESWADIDLTENIMHASDKLLKDALFEEIKRLEESLWQAKTRYDNALMDQTFAQDFFEFGRSGRTYARSEMLFEQEETQEIDAKIPLPQFHARYISSDVIQTTYVSEVRYDGIVQRGNRSSIWSKVDGSWCLRFHQGTPIADE